MKNCNKETAAHNLALILTQASINEVEKTQLSINVGEYSPDFKYLMDLTKKYSFFYDKFYTYSLNHFETVLNDEE